VALLSGLDRKLLRDLRQARGQAVAIALVIGSGMALYVLMLSTFESLDATQRAYYDRYRFADVFASCKRAPLRLEEDLREIPGVSAVRTRVVVDVTLDLPDVVEPAVGRLISMPEVHRPVLCDVAIQAGRYLEPGRSDEVLISEGFASANALRPGDSLAAVINGRRHELTVAGIALSPEYVYTIRPGEMLPDDRRFGIVWMERRALAAAFQMEGGFNDVLLTLQPTANEREVIDRVDRILEDYGGLGAYPRAQQISHFYLESELDGLRAFGAIIPIVFLGVAAFLLNVVLARQVAVQREQIAALKAMGYTNRAVGWHYAKSAMLIAAAGCAIGVAVGAWLGSGMTEMYTEFFAFPLLLYRLSPDILVTAIAISLIAALLGALIAVGRAVRLPPAEAMRPEAPPVFRAGWMEHSAAGRLLTQPTRIVLRNLRRHRGRAAISVVGIAAAGGLLVMGTFSIDAMDEMISLQFYRAQRFDLVVTFVEPASPAALHELESLAGVLDVEAFRSVPVRLRHEHRVRNLAVTGQSPTADLSRVLDMDGKVIPMPPSGIVLSKALGDILGARPGELVTLEVLEGTRPVHEVRVAAWVDDLMGLNAYMDGDALHRMMGEAPLLSGAYLTVDEAQVDAVYRRLKHTPRVAGVGLKDSAIESFNETMGEMVAMIRFVNVLFAAVITFGVVYNAARISLSERSRELATLRVIGFTRGEISYILLGELGLITVLAVPLGLLVGYGLAAGLVALYTTDAWRMPLVVSSSTYAFAALTVIVATVVSAWAVRRKLHRLDLVEVLKTRE